MFGLLMDRDSALSLPQQLTREVRERILQGKLARGEALPASRLLARDLGVGRNVVVQAYEQLLAEGYLTSRVGAGTFVADLSVSRAHVRPVASAPGPGPAPRRAAGAISFSPGLPDLGRFPRSRW